MRIRSVLLIVLFIVLLGFGGNALGQTCVGLACQQQTCPGNGTTSITGTVYAPNGTDPLPNVTVYIPNAPVDPFTPGVSCPVVGTPPSGSPLVGTETDVNGKFTLIDVPVGSNIPLVIISGRWRRQLVIPSITACVPNPMASDFAVMPKNQTQGDIPKIAIATGSVDQVECVLRKVGIEDSEFTNPGGSGRINLYSGSNSPGARIDTTTPSESTLMSSPTALNSYDVLMLPCQGGQFIQPTSQLANFVQFANSGGRVYSSHYSYVWMYNNPPFDGVANWKVNAGSFPDGLATVDTSFTAGQTLANWLQNVGASTTLGQMQLNTLKHDMIGVIPPTRSWLTLNSGNTADPNPVMQLVFDAPIPPPGTKVNQCGRVLYNEYHVENPLSSPTGKSFPTECTSGTVTPQEKLLEYMLFELTDDGGQPSLDPTTKDFGSEAIGFPSATQTFTWTNNSSFTSQVTSAAIAGSNTDFAITSNNCASVPGGSSCQITVVFTPSALGVRTGTLAVASSGNTLTATLTGTGTPGFSISPTTLSFGSVDVTATASQTLTLTNVAGGPLPVPVLVTTGQYSVSTAACGNTLAALATCAVKVTFLPTSTGPQNGTVGVNSTSLLYSGLNAALTGNGVDFTVFLNPASGTVVAGDGASTTATLTPLAGFATPLTVTCTVGGAVASSCGLASASVTPPAADVISMTTTSQFTVVGFGGFGGRGYMWLIALGSGWLLWRTRRRAGSMLRSGLMVALLAAIGFSMTGCSGKLPKRNAAYTGPGSYTITVTATDGILTHSATYKLTVSAK
jgi:hypothetical protein